MKKVLSFIAFFTLLVVLLSSCKSQELCPAYGKTNVKVNTEKQI